MKECIKCKWHHSAKGNGRYFLSWCIYDHEDNPNYGERIDDGADKADGCKFFELHDLWKNDED